MLVNHSATFKGFTIMTCIKACISSGSWVPRSRGGGGGRVQPQSHPKAEEHPLGYQSAN